MGADGRHYHQAHFTVLALVQERGWKIGVEKTSAGLDRMIVIGCDSDTIERCTEALERVLDERDVGEDEAWKVCCRMVPRLAGGP